jgi:hypothetical protein
MPSNNNTPSARSLRSNSQTDLTLSSIKALIDASKDEIITSLRAEMQSLKESISSLSRRVDRLEEENRIRQDTLLQRNSEPLSVEGACSEIMNEFEQRNRRKLNLIIFGVPEAVAGTIADRKAADKEQCSEIFEAIGLRDCAIKDVSRIGKVTGEKRRLLRVSLAKEDDKYHLVAHSKNLRHVPKFDNIYVKPDLTHLQRKIDFELRRELQAKKKAEPSEDFVIRRGKVIPRNHSQGFRKAF